ncbi:hypothetical protein QL285_036597 [Trifolium repens]|nr:hypothetical protein QL285_036597 [Trifolium repens]
MVSTPPSSPPPIPDPLTSSSETVQESTLAPHTSKKAVYPINRLPSAALSNFSSPYHSLFRISDLTANISFN